MKVDFLSCFFCIGNTSDELAVLVSDTNKVIVLCKYVNALFNVIHLYCWFIGTTVNV